MSLELRLETMRKVAGGFANWKIAPNGVYGSINANTIIATLLRRRGLLGLLLQNGDFSLVLMTKITRVCEVRDSINHAVWNSGSEALKAKSIVKNVRKSKRELTGPKEHHKSSNEAYIKLLRLLNIFPVNIIYRYC
jgi:hypothetical protein